MTTIGTAIVIFTLFVTAIAAGDAVQELYQRLAS